jgi:hypothetical protein
MPGAYDAGRRLERSSADLDRLRLDVLRMRRTIGALIAWLAESPQAPITRADAAILLQQLDGDGE